LREQIIKIDGGAHSAPAKRAGTARGLTALRPRARQRGDRNLRGRTVCICQQDASKYPWRRALHSPDLTRPASFVKYGGLRPNFRSSLAEVAGGTLRLARASPTPRPVDLCVLAEAALRMQQGAIESKAAHVVVCHFFMMFLSEEAGRLLPRIRLAFPYK